MKRHLLLGALMFCAACTTPHQRLNVAELRGKAEAGDTSAAVAMGLLYDSGMEVSKDQAEAARWYRIAADKGRKRYAKVAEVHSAGAQRPLTSCNAPLSRIYRRFAPRTPPSRPSRILCALRVKAFLFFFSLPHCLIVN